MDSKIMYKRNLTIATLAKIQNSQIKNTVNLQLSYLKKYHGINYVYI